MREGKAKGFWTAEPAFLPGLLPVPLQYSQSGSEQYCEPTSSGDSSEARNGLIGHAAMLPGALDTFENQSGEHTRSHKASAPLGIPRRSRLRSHSFIESFPLFLESRHLVPDSDQKVAVEGEL